MTVEQRYLRWSFTKAALLNGFGILAVVHWATGTGLGPLQLVLLGTALETAILVAEIPTGVVADTFSRKWSLVIGHLVVGVGMAAGALVDFGPLIVAQILWGVGWTFTSGADTAWVTDELDDPERIDSVITRAARRRQYGRIAGIAGAGAAGLIVPLPPILVGFGVAFALVGIGVARWPERNFQPASEDRLADARRVLAAGAALARRDRRLALLLAVVVVFHSGMELIDRLFPARLDDVGFPASGSPVAWVAGITLVGAAGGAVLLGRLDEVMASESGPRVVFAMAAASAAAGAVGLASAGSFLVAATAVFAIRGLSVAALEVATVNWANRRATSDVRATVHSFVGQAESVGEIMGGVALGALARTAGLPTALVGSAVLFGGAAVLVGSVRPGRPRSDRSVTPPGAARS